MQSLPRIILNKGKERSVLNKHPWLFSGAIKSKEAGIGEGDVVQVFSSDQKFLALGHFHNGSIAVKLFSFQQLQPDASFWAKKMSDAYLERKALGFTDNPETNCYRLVHGEGDGIPGLIIDYYKGVAVLQTHSAGMFALRSVFADALKAIYGDELLAVFDKSIKVDNNTQAKSLVNDYLYKHPSIVQHEHWVKENGLSFLVNWEEGQKTAFFLDQRDNRSLLQKYCKDKKVLNAFSYSGGFSVYALKGGAKLVHSVDSSTKAGNWCRKNVTENFNTAPHEFFEEDVFDFFKRKRESYEVMVVDPPAFAKHMSSLRKASYGYQSLNAEAIRQISPGGILFTFSCSQVVDKKLFRQLIFSAAIEAGREVTLLHQLSQPPDHPINLFHPEGEYLKGLVLRVK